MYKMNPALKLKNWRELSMAIVDVETTSLDTQAEDFRIIQFAGILVAGDRIIETVNLYIDPLMEVPEKITEITKIKTSDVKGQPPFAERADKIFSFLLEADILCAFHSDYEKASFATEFGRLDMPTILTPYLDPLIWAREKKGNRNKQSDVAKRYGCAKMGQISHGEGHLHNAMHDIEVLWDIVKAMSPDLPYSYQDLIETQEGYRVRQEAYREKVAAGKAAAAAAKKKKKAEKED